jgi:epsilon-lactone hydrolase
MQACLSTCFYYTEYPTEEKMSLRSKFWITLIRNRHLFQGKLKPEIIDESFSVEKFRQSIDHMSARDTKAIKDLSIKSTTIKGLNAEWLLPKDAPKDKAILYIHGGGFISGSCLTHRRHVAKFALGTGFNTLLFDYRLAPEHPFPAALEDCVTAYERLLEQGLSPSNIVLCGESAGASLTLATLLAIRDKQLPLPSKAVAISPVTDLTCKAPSFTYNAPRDIAPKNSWTVWTQYYIGDNDPKLPHLSPLNGDLHGLPALFLCVGSHEIHLDDTVNFAKKATSQGVNVILKVHPGMIHAFPLLAPLFPEATRAMQEICTFISS